MKRIFFLLFAGALFGESVYLNNDSPYTLTAQVNGASGIFLTQIVLQPGDQIRVDFTVPSQALSVTPFFVVWKCPYGEEYATGTASSGDFVKASICVGTKTCPEKKKGSSK